MNLRSSFVWDALEAQGAKKLYHANSVITSCQFLRQKALLARGTVEHLGLKQSGQYTDAIDKKYSLWFDVFADSVDIHDRGSMANKYGPVLFVLDVAKLRASYTGNLWVTKLNPTKWDGTPKAGWWFQSKAELEADFVVGDFDHMIVFRHRGGMLPIAKCLDKIILDEPNRDYEGCDLASIGHGALALAMNDSSLDVPIELRDCSLACACHTYYRNKPTKSVEMFYPYA